MAAGPAETRRWWESRDQRSTALAALLGVLVGSSLTGGVSYLISTQAIEAQHAAQSADFNEQRSVETRAKRGEVYQTLLDTAVKWRSTLGDDIACRQAADQGTCARPRPVEADAAAFRAAIFSVYIYGSTEAWQRANKIADTLPSTWPGLGNAVDTTKAVIDAKAFSDAYDRFEQLMCSELPAQPRSDC